MDGSEVPIINENDSTNTPELRFGDNDNLAALTAVQLEADALCRSALESSPGLGSMPNVVETCVKRPKSMNFHRRFIVFHSILVEFSRFLLGLFTDVSCVYTANPRTNPDAKPLYLVQEPWALQVETKDPGSGLGTGGM